MKKEIKAISRFLIIFLFITLNAHADFQVRIVQFQPIDAPPEKFDILELVKDAQEFYRNEMQRHGYGPKTFRVENIAGEFRVHTVNGNHPIERYTTATPAEVIEEFPAELPHPNNVYIVVINGLQGFKGPDGISAGVSRNASCEVSGGELCLAGSNPLLDFRTLVQTLGITFGLRSNISNPKSIMHGNLAARMGEDQGELSDYEARWLDKSHYFNPLHHIPLHHINSLPEMKAVLPVIVGRKTIRIRVNLSSRIKLHQAIVMRHWKDVIGYDFLSGTKDTAHFQIEKNLLEGVRFLQMNVMDINGNNCVHYVKVDLAAPVNANQKKLIPWAIIKR